MQYIHKPINPLAFPLMFFNLFGPPEAYATGYLPEENGHKVFYHQFGNPKGLPVLVFHGGPGDSSKPKHAALFDLKKYRVIQFDQRGCGQSLPFAETKNNTPADVLKDTKRILDHLNIQKCIVYGVSWGSTLALLFAQRYPDNILKMIFGMTVLARKRDIDWISEETRRFYPDIIEHLEQDIKDGKTLRQHYADLMASDKPADQIRSIKLYGQYEFMIGKLNPRFADIQPTAQDLQYFKIYMHYDALNYGVKDNEILENMHKIAHIPALILHNRLDLVCPVEQSWLVHKAMPHSKLVIVPDYGHSSDLLKKTSKKEIKEFLK
jgi:proline iminopeptidase